MRIKYLTEVEVMSGFYQGYKGRVLQEKVGLRSFDAFAPLEYCYHYKIEGLPKHWFSEGQLKA